MRKIHVLKSGDVEIDNVNKGKFPRVAKAIEDAATSLGLEPTRDKTTWKMGRRASGSRRRRAELALFISVGVARIDGVEVVSEDFPEIDFGSVVGTRILGTWIAEFRNWTELAEHHASEHRAALKKRDKKRKLIWEALSA